MSNVSFTLWSVIKTPIFLCFKYPIKFFKSWIAIGSMPEKGSSNKMWVGLEAMHLAISTLLLSPPDKVIPSEDLIFVILNSTSKSSRIWYLLWLSNSLVSIIDNKLSSTDNPLNIDVSWGR